MDDTTMHREDEHRYEEDRHGPGVTEAEVLIGRVVDDEATPADRVRFEHLALGDPMLWKMLALRHEDARRLRDEFRAVTAEARRVDLPDRRWRPTWTLAVSGWAAGVIIALAWGALSLGGPVEPGSAVVPAATPAALSPVQHFQEYLAAPFVLGDLQPVVVQVDELSDGRIAVHFIRRIEEVAFLDPSAGLPVDDSGELIKDPAVLRALEPAVGWPGDGKAGEHPAPPG